MLDQVTRWWRPVSSTSRRRRLISLTPLIDVVFILLVFFMLAARSGERVLMEPAGGVTLQTVVAVLDRLAAAGVTDLALVPERPE